MKKRSHNYKDSNSSKENIVTEPVSNYYTPSSPSFFHNLNFKELLDNKMSMIQKINSGITYAQFTAIASKLPFKEAEWAELLGISSKSLQRYKIDENHTFKSIQSEKILEVAEVMILGYEVLESEANFNKWVMVPSLALGGMSPFSLLSSSYGKELVMDELHRIEHGIFA